MPQRHDPHRPSPAMPPAEPAFGGSALRAAASRAAGHFAGRDAGDPAEPPDAVELWGRRIGRALSLAACAALAVYIYVTYLR
jgi:hypothetical protein